MRYVEMANELTVNRRIRFGMAQTLMIMADETGVADYGDFKVIRTGADYRIEEPDTTEPTTIEQSTTEPAHARKWLTESGLEAGAATRLLSASQHNAGREQADGAHKVLFTLAHSTPRGFQQNTWTITRPITRAAG